MKRKILFLCTQNACRSQIAEGLLRHLADCCYEAFSAGIAPSAIDQRAFLVMQEIGIDISGQFSKSVDIFSSKSFDAVITVCDHAKESCPVLPGAVKVLHWGFADPAKAVGTEEQILSAFRQIRDQICDRIKQAVEHQEI